mmetsp:Transcript_15564/g.35879  ORF Transcript_15564/g.35879 Transcript_15564/m.35879 type:complete len:204 (+) Transcript_15564:83-694(+)
MARVISVGTHPKMVERLPWNRDLATWDERNQWKLKPKTGIRVPASFDRMRGGREGVAMLPLHRRIVQLQEESREKVVEPFCCRYRVNEMVESSGWTPPATVGVSPTMGTAGAHTALEGRTAWRLPPQQDFDELSSVAGDGEGDLGISPAAVEAAVDKGEGIALSRDPVSGASNLDSAAKAHRKHLSLHSGRPGAEEGTRTGAA